MKSPKSKENDFQQKRESEIIDNILNLRESVNSMGRIFVIGGANIDICGASIEPLINFDSNPGTISVAFGGVGRNIAEYLSLFGEDVSFVTAFSHDHYGTLLREDCESLGIDCSSCITTQEYPSSMYIAILDHDRDMRIAMSDMRVLRAFTPEMLSDVLKRTSKDDIIMIDANLDIRSIHYIAENAECTLAADPVSVSKSSRIATVLERLSVFKPNIYEAESMSGIKIKDRESALKALEWFLAKGVKEVIISMAEKGILLAYDDVRIHFTHRIVEVENATGGGDSFLAAYMAARNSGKKPEEAVRFAIAAAVNVIERQGSERRQINRDLIENSIGQINIKEQNI